MNTYHFIKVKFRYTPGIFQRLLAQPLSRRNAVLVLTIQQ